MDAIGRRSLRNEVRIPFFAPVRSPELSRCWATNLSKGGIGLTALVDRASPPARGSVIKLSFALGRNKRSVEARGRIAWRSLPRPDGRIGLGVQFLELDPTDRAVLARFVESHRPRVIVALGSDDDRAVADAALDELQVDAVASEAELSPDLLRSCAAIFVFSEDVDAIDRFTQALEYVHSQAVVAPDEHPLPPVTLCASIDSELLLPLSSAGAIHEILRPPIDAATLALAARRSCEHWALQLELSWASLQLESTRAAPSRSRSGGAEPPTASRGHRRTIIRVDPAMKRTYELIESVAVHDVPVLLLGETGTGKELAAREVHALSRRVDTPFVAQDCGALTETLLESELFGHVRGAFTGATSDHPGLFQLADGGTIFLDEIQNTTATLQAKLLRVVEEGEIRPVGSAKVRQVDVRLIAACNTDLRGEVEARRFRADFYYRLNRFPIQLPPLRERPECIPELARHFIALITEQLGRPACELEPGLESMLQSYDWPGNVRELKNAIERSILLTPSGQPLRCDALPDEVREGGHASAAISRGLEEQVDAFARRIIADALARNDGVIRRAAADLLVNPVTLSRRMRKLGLA